MALTRCCLQRAFVGFSNSICRQNPCALIKSSKFQRLEEVSITQSNTYSSFGASTPVDSLVNLTQYESVPSPPEWKYVERILPLKTVPKPMLKESYPSGWKPQLPECFNMPYYVGRSKNHFIPVYLKNSHRGTRKLTSIRYIKGDIWMLAEEIKAYLKKKNDRVIVLRVHELCGTILVKGDYVYDVNDFLSSKGF